MAELRVALAGDDGPRPTKQTCPDCREGLLAAGPELVGCSACNLVSVGVQCACTAQTRFEWTGQVAGPARWLRLSVWRAVPVYACSASCAVITIDALVATGAVTAGPE